MRLNSSFRSEGLPENEIAFSTSNVLFFFHLSSERGKREAEEREEERVKKEMEDMEKELEGAGDEG